MSDLSILRTWPICNWKWPRPIVYVPLPQALPFCDDVFPNFIEIARSGVDFMHLPYGFTDKMRNVAADRLMAEKGDHRHTHILMLDSDHQHQNDIVQRLCRWVIEDPEKEIVAALNFKRTEPYSPCAFLEQEDGLYRVHEWDETEDFPLDVARVGFGAVLIAREVFETMHRPWFYHDFSGAEFDPDFVYPGHDLDFCRRAREYGFKVWCDLNLTSPHMTSNKVTKKTYQTYCAMIGDIGTKDYLVDQDGLSRKEE